jgi:SAM-dependent methyltransferase
LYREEFSILDVGCGQGDLLADLRREGYEATGIDIDPDCVSISQKVGIAKTGGVFDIPKMFRSNSFDLVVASHVLEHLDNPLLGVQYLQDVAKEWIILAVPNPLRLQYIIRSGLFSKICDPRPGHVQVWDPGHFKNFLIRHCGLNIRNWDSDWIKIVPNNRLRGTLRRIGLSNTLDTIEARVLPKLFPFLSDSLIVLCQK